MTCDRCNQKGIKGMLHRKPDCPHRPHTCQHCKKKGTYADTTEHLRVCPERPHTCQHCEKKGTYADITEHLRVCPERPHACQHCGMKDTYAAITGPHDKVCPKRPVSCDKCDWKGILSLLDHHRNNDCPQRPHSCRYCGTRGAYTVISGPHLQACVQRPHTCQHCGTTGPYTEITGSHDKVCPRKPVSCAKCGWKGIQNLFDHHRNNDCPQRPHSCQYCGTKGTYSAITERLHSCQYCGVIDTHAAITGPHVKVCPKKPISCDKCDRQRPFECRYCGEKGTYKTISGPHNAVCKKKPVPCPNNECDSKIQRLGIKRHLENCVYEEIPCKYAKLGCGTKVKRKDAPRHEADASNHHELSLQTTLHLQDIVNKLNITCSPVTFALSGYVRRRTHDHVVVSPSFYTSRRGYNMAVEIHTKNGEIEAFVQMKPGLHDSKLKWPFTGKVTIELLNQLEDQNHIKLKESTERINRRGQTRLLINYCLPQDAINTCLKDDTLFFKVTVEAFSHKSWLECTENNGN